MGFRFVTWLISMLSVVLSTTLSSAAPPATAIPCPTEFASLGQSLGQIHSRTPKVIPRWANIPLAEKVLDPERLRKAVTIIDPLNASPESIAALGKLKPNTYLYVIDKQGRIAIVPRSLDPGADAMKEAGATFLGSHEGLVRTLENPNGPPGAISTRVEVVSAGEIVVRDGRVMAITNGSGSYRGDAESLQYGIEQLRAAGVDVNPRTRALDYSTGAIPDPHDSAAKQARTEIQALRNPHFVSILDEARRAITALDHRFPDEAELARNFMQSSTNENRNLYFRTAMFVAQWQRPLESEIVALQRSIERFGEPEIHSMLSVIESLAAGRAH